MTAFLFIVATIMVLGGALGVILSRNPVHSALLLVATLIGVAVYFVMQDAHLVAAVQVIVYASAIVVLFLFVIMLLGVDQHESLEDPIKFQRPAAIAIGAVVAVELIVLAGHTWATGAHHVHGRIPKHASNNIKAVAQRLFTDYLWAFEITALLLVIAVVGAIVIARKPRSREGRPGGESQQVRV